MPPGLAALVLQAQVIFTVVIAAGVLRERPTRPQVIGVALGALGLVVVAVGRGGHVTAGALVLCLLAALSWGIGNVVSRASGVTGGLSLTVWSAAVVPVPLFALSLLLDGPATVADALTSFSWQAVVSTAYTAGLASLVGYAIFNGLLSRNQSSSVVPWVLLAPVVAMASAWSLLDERPTTAELAGGAVLVIGVLVAMRGGVRRAPLLVSPQPSSCRGQRMNSAYSSVDHWSRPTASRSQLLEVGLAGCAGGEVQQHRRGLAGLVAEPVQAALRARARSHPGRVSIQRAPSKIPDGAGQDVERLGDRPVKWGSGRPRAAGISQRYIPNWPLVLAPVAQVVGSGAAAGVVFSSGGVLVGR